MAPATHVVQVDPLDEQVHEPLEAPVHARLAHQARWVGMGRRRGWWG